MDASGSKAARQSVHLGCRCMEPGTLSGASEGGMKVGRIKAPLYKESYLGITPPTFIPPFEAPDSRSKGWLKGSKLLHPFFIPIPKP